MGWGFSPLTSLLRLDALDGRAKLSHDAAISGRVPRGSWSPGPPALRGPAIVTRRNSAVSGFCPKNTQSRLWTGLLGGLGF